MDTVIMTSSLNLYEKDELGNRFPHQFGNDNGILDMIKSNVKKYDNFLFIASAEDKPEATDMYAGVTFESFDLTLPFKNYKVLDGRNADKARELIKEADFIYLCGGHLPSQNAFFNNINLKDIIRDTDALIVGASAGSMNCAGTVYCPPELEGESLDPNFQIYLKGLGFTNINILPHYEKYCDAILDDKRYIEDIVLPDSFDIEILFIVDGTYIVCRDGKETIYGLAYRVKDGKIEKVCDVGKSIIWS
ncbi:MAG: dipeptidase E [Clostridiales bacterium]|nr:dipeptidase E [Clostridiales bacterium]